MDNEKLINNWHKKILTDCEKCLGRALSKVEEEFIRSRGSFIALEVIEDTVLSMNKKELLKYLNSESSSLGTKGS
jgi:hypothetical protein